MHEREPNDDENPAQPEGREPETQAERDVERQQPRIYVASLADYNDGRLHGSWIDAAQDVETLNACIQDMLDASPSPFAEEWAIHDYDGFEFVQLGEYESIEAVSKVALGIAEHGRAFAAWASHVGLYSSDLDDFQDAYMGHWSSPKAFAEEMLDDLGYLDEFNKALPDHLAPYITFDYEGFAQDLVFNSAIVTVEDSDGSIFVFWS